MAEQKRTQFAMQAFGFAELFNLQLGDKPVAGHRVELSAPDGPSTGGGKQSVQHVKLVPLDGAGPVTVAGSANQLDKLAEIRSFEYLAELHAQRFKGAEIPLDKAAYQGLVARMQAFFAEQGLRVVMLEPPRPVAGAPAKAAAAASGPSPVAMVAIFAGVAAVIAAVLFFVLRAKHG